MMVSSRQLQPHSDRRPGRTAGTDVVWAVSEGFKAAETLAASRQRWPRGAKFAGFGASAGKYDKL